MSINAYPVVSNSAVAVTAGAYSTGNCVGALRTFGAAGAEAGQAGLVRSVVLRDKAGQTGTYDLFLFSSAPAAPTDKTAIALTAADLAKCIGVVPLAAVSLGAATTMGVSTAANLGLAYNIGGAGILYGILVTRGTPTYASTSDVSVDLVTAPAA